LETFRFNVAVKSPTYIVAYGWHHYGFDDDVTSVHWNWGFSRLQRRSTERNMLDDAQINTLADQLIISIDLQAWLGKFHWNQQALTECEILARSGVAGKAEHYADLVDRQGFGGQPARENVAFVQSFHSWHHEGRL
jgi:hypothetical protein